MSVDAYVISDEAKCFIHLGKLGAGGFSFGSWRGDPGGKKAGSFIGGFLGTRGLKIVRCEDIPSNYEEYVDSDVENEPIIGQTETDILRDMESF